MYFIKIFFRRGSFDSVCLFDPQSLRGEVPAGEIPSGVPGAQREVSETGWDQRDWRVSRISVTDSRLSKQIFCHKICLKKWKIYKDKIIQP